MARTAKYTVEQIQMIHAQMVENNWSLQQVAKDNTVFSFGEKWQTLRAAFKKNGLEPNLKKIQKQVIAV